MMSDLLFKIVQRKQQKTKAERKKKRKKKTWPNVGNLGLRGLSQGSSFYCSLLLHVCNVNKKCVWGGGRCLLHGGHGTAEQAEGTHSAEAQGGNKLGDFQKSLEGSSIKDRIKFMLWKHCSGSCTQGQDRKRPSGELRLQDSRCKMRAARPGHISADREKGMV